MRSRRTELRDDVAAIIAASRELAPGHDEALAEVLLDRLEATSRRPRTDVRRMIPAWLSRRVLAGAIVAVVCFAAGGIVASTENGGSNGSAGNGDIAAVPKVIGIKDGAFQKHVVRVYPVSPKTLQGPTSKIQP